MGKVKDWRKICREYAGLWVALEDDEETVISSGQTVESVLEDAKEKGNDNPILFRVPTKLVTLVGSQG